MTFPEIGVKQVVEGEEQFNQAMRQYEQVLNKATVSADKFGASSTKAMSSSGNAAKGLNNHLLGLQSQTTGTAKGVTGLNNHLSGLVGQASGATKSVSMTGDAVKKTGDEAQTASGKTGKFSDGLNTLFKVAAGAVILDRVVDGLVRFGKEALKTASDFGEMENMFQAVFKEESPKARAELDKYAASINRSSNTMLGFAATIQDTLVPLGFARSAATDLSVEAVKLATDLGSFKNIDTASVINDIQSALVGNGEVMKKYGVILNVATTNQELLNMGIEGGYNAATEQEKALARLNVVLNGTRDAQGDAARTSQENANLIKSQADAYYDLQIAIGTAVIPATNELIKVTIEGTKRLTALLQISEQVRNAYAAQEQQAFSTADSYGAYVEEVLGAQVRTGKLDEAVAALITTNAYNGILAESVAKKYDLQSQSAFYLARMSKETTEQHYRLQNQFQETGDEAEDLTKEIENLNAQNADAARYAEQAADSLEVQARATVEAKNTTDLLKGALDAGAISQYEYELMTLQAKEGTLQLSEAQRQQYEDAINAAEANKENADAIEATNSAANDAAVSLSNMAESLKGANQAKVAAEAVNILEDALRNAATEAERKVISDEIEQIQLDAGLANTRSIELAKGLAMIQDGVVPITEVDKAYKALFESAGEQTAADILAPFTAIEEGASGAETAITGKDWSAVGAQIPEGMGLGIASQTQTIADATDTGIQEPVFDTIEGGAWTTLGSDTIAAQIATGISNSADLAIEAAGQMVDGIIQELNRIPRNIPVVVTTYYREEGESAPTGGGSSSGNRVGGCFVGNTLVNIPGGYKYIDDIQIGDTVISWSDDKAIETKVKATRVVSRDDTVMVCTDSEQIHCTPNHRFLTPAGWVEARYLLGKFVITANGKEAVYDVYKVDGVYDVYNFEVDHECHTYMVHDVVVHNIKVATGLDNFMVPEKYTNDSFPIFAQAGELVNVMPKSEVIRQQAFNSQVNNSSNVTKNFNLNLETVKGPNEVVRSFAIAQLMES